MSTSTTNAWFSTLTDGAMGADLAALAADGALSYAEALQLLNDAASDGAFTTAEFQDLRTIAAHMNNGVTASSYVADIFIQLVQGNPANVSWNGGSALAAPLGNLHAGSSAGQLQQLIGKWFLGTDLPDPAMKEDDTGHQAGPLHYGTETGPLYGRTGAAAIVDVAQGAVGDCVVCANMIELVNNHPDLLRSMIVDNGNGTYGVRFYLDGNEVWVTVDNELPLEASGRLVYAHNGVQQDQALWAPLLEKAYAQLSETGMVGHPSINSYENIDGNFSGIVSPAMSNGSVTYYRTTDSDWAGKRDLLIRALAEHRDVVLETAHDAAKTQNSDGLTELVGSHAYAVLGYDDASGKFIVRNPWGDSYARQHWVAQFELSMEQMAAEGGAVAVANRSGPATIEAAAASYYLGLSAAVAVAPLFSVFNPDALEVKNYQFHAAGSGTLKLNGATNLATPEQQAAGNVVIAAADLAKLQFAAPAAGGNGTLAIQALLGQQWSQSSEIDWRFSDLAGDTLVLPKTHNSVAAGASVALSSLFQLDGANSGNLFYEVIVPGGQGGSIDLHGARNLEMDALPGHYELSAADMRLVTYQAPATAGTVTLRLNAYHGAGWGLEQHVTIAVGGGDVAQAWQNYANGQLAAIGSVTDSAANIFSHLDQLQTLLHGDWLDAIQVSDATAQVQTISAAQYDQQRGLLHTLGGNYSVAITDATATAAAQLGMELGSHLATLTVSASAADVTANLDALQALAAAGKLGTVTLTDSGKPTLAVGSAQLRGDAGALAKLAGSYTLAVTDAGVADAVTLAAAHPNATFAVNDSAAQLVSHLGALQALAAQGQLASLALTDAATPVLHLTSAQLVADAAVLHAITSPYTVSVPGLSDAVVRFVIQQDGGPRGAATAVTPLAPGVAAPAGANTVVGFQDAALGHGYNAVVLDQARDHYALRSDSTGKLEIENVAAGDADFGKHVTITGADYLVFNGATATDAGFYPDMYFLVDSHNAAVAELYMAALGRQPRLTGLEFWENQLAAGVPLADIAAGFIGSAEFGSRYLSAATPSDHGGAGDLAFVNALYQNVLHRAPKPAGLAFWVNDLAHGDSRANVLVAFATSPEDETNTHAAPGHANGWLIDSGKGGYADPALLLNAATALTQGLANGYLNTGLIDPATVGNGVKAGAASLSGTTLTLGAGLAPQGVVLSDAVNHVVVDGAGQQIYSGGHAAITIHGAGNAVRVAGADQLDLLGGSDSTVTGFVPGAGSTLHLAAGAGQGAPALVDASVARVAATSLSFEAGHGYVIRVGSLGDGSADAAAAVINRAYTVAGALAEHATFIGQDAAGNTQAWLFGQAGGTATVAADHNGNHLVDGAELLHLATLVGVNPAQIGAADLA